MCSNYDYKFCLRRRDELVYLKLMVSMTDHMRNSVNSSSYFWNIIKCRQLIFENVHLIAYPKAQFQLDQYEIDVLMPKDQYQNPNQFKDYLNKIHLNVLSQSFEITTGVYEMALRFTIRARISPYWNYLDNYYVRGRNFLFSNGELHCVQMYLDISESDVAFVNFSTFDIHIERKNVDEIAVEQSCQEEFNRNSKYLLIPVLPKDTEIKVLPSLNDSKILSISHQIPSNSPFKNFAQLRRYWKNLYGYRLPYEENQSLYYQLFFPNRDTIFTYPSICVANKVVKFKNNKNKKFAINDFVLCLEHRIKTVLNQPIRLNRSWKSKVSIDENNNEPQASRSACDENNNETHQSKCKNDENNNEI